MADPWADFRIQTPAVPAAPQAPAAAPTQTVDPWAEFKSPGITMGDVGNAVSTVINTLGTGFTKGFQGIGGFRGDTRNLAGSVADWLGPKIGDPGLGPAYKQIIAHELPGPTSANLAVLTPKGSTGPWAMPETNAGDNPALSFKPPILGGGTVNVGKMIDAGIQAVPSIIAGGGGGGRMAAVTPAVTSGVGGEIAGQAAEGAGAPKWLQIAARILGGGAGYAAGNRAVSPLPSALVPEEARSVATAQAIDAPMSVFQETGRGKGLELGVSRSFGGGGPFEALREKQALATQGKVLENIGVTGINRTDPASMAEVFAQKNAEFNAAKNIATPVTLDNQFYRDLAGHVQNYVDNTNPSTRIPSVAKRAQDFLDRAAASTTGPNGPTVTAREYQSLRSDVGTASYNATNPQAKQALKGIRTALDDAMARSVTPAQAAAFQTARANWAGLKTISKAAVGGTVGARSEGNISPSALATALKASQGPDVYARTTGGINDIARMSAYLADKVPSSGTGETMNAQEAIRSFLPGAAGSAGAGAATGAFLGGPLGAVIGGVAGASAPALKVMSNNLLARILTGQGFGGRTLHRWLVNQNAQNLNPALIGALVGTSQAGQQGRQ